MKVVCLRLSHISMPQENAVRIWALSNKDDLLDRYAALCLEEWESRGRDVRPLKAYIASLAHPKLSPST